MIVVALFIGLAVGIAATVLWKYVDDMHKRIERLEKANQLRLPYQAFEEMLDGMAALDVRDREIKFEQAIMDNARAHFAKAMAAGTKREEK